MPLLRSHGPIDKHKRVLRANQHIVQRSQTNRLTGQQEKFDRVTKQLLLLRQPEMRFRACRLCTLLNRHNVKQKRDQVLGKVDAAGLSFPLEEIEPKRTVNAKETPVVFSAGSLKVGFPTI